MIGELDLTKLRAFVTLAEYLHFGRAAEALHLTQPGLSRQIQTLERQLGARLLERDRRNVALTEAGRQLLEDAVPLLEAANATRQRVVRAARGPRRLVALRRDHPLAQTDELWQSDIADKRHLRYLQPLQPGETPIRSVEEKLEHVAAGQGIIVLPLSAFDLPPPTPHVADRPHTTYHEPFGFEPTTGIRAPRAAG